MKGTGKKKVKCTMHEKMGSIYAGMKNGVLEQKWQMSTRIFFFSRFQLRTAATEQLYYTARSSAMQSKVESTLYHFLPLVVTVSDNSL